MVRKYFSNIMYVVDGRKESLNDALDTHVHTQLKSIYLLFCPKTVMRFSSVQQSELTMTI